MPKFYLTTAIDYSNGDPHLGHALEKIGADCIARYHRLRGDDVHFLMGMDEHSQSVIQAAAGGGVTPQAWVDRMAATFADHWRRLECSHDDWIRTTEPRHIRGVVALLERIQQRRPDDLFVAEYEGLYCTGCEEFKTPAQIANGHCIEHPTLTLVPVKEENHFFRLSAYRDAVLARLLAAGFESPRLVWGHGYVQWEGPKMRKTAGTAVSLDAAVERYGADALRYFLLREVGFTNDGDFTWERFDTRYTADLANTFGNLVSRALTMIHSYRGGTVPHPSGARGTALDDAARETVALYQRAMDGNRVEEGAAHWMDLAARANRYIEETAPWKLAKAGRDAELDQVLGSLARTVARLALLAAPFIPATADAVWTLFAPPAPLAEVRLADLGDLAIDGRAVGKPPILFPKPRPASA